MMLTNNIEPPEDMRKYLECDRCGSEIHIGNAAYEGDVFYDVDGYRLCEDCFDYVSKWEWRKTLNEEP